MRDQTIDIDDTNSQSAVLLEEQSPADALADTWTGARCEKCAAPTKSDGVTICRQCGWYANLGTYLEVDPNYEFEQESAPRDPVSQPSHVKVWIGLIPWWG